MYNTHMNKFKFALESRGISPSDASAKGIPLATVQKHYYGSRNVGIKSVLKYEDILGIPRSELRPDLWPPAIATPATSPEASRGGGDAA